MNLIISTTIALKQLSNLEVLLQAMLRKVLSSFVTFFVTQFFLSFVIQNHVHRILIALLVPFIRGLLLKRSSFENLPPGPTGLPLIGILPWLIYYRSYEYIAYLSEKYGPIVKIQLGSQTVIFINDYELGRKLSIHPDFQGRPRVGFFMDLTKDLGIIMTEGNHWKHQRRFMVHALKDCGMGKLHMQDKIHMELKNLVKEIDRFQGIPISIHEVVEKSTCNIICSLVFNQQYEYDDPDLIKRLKNLDENMRLIEKLQFLTEFKFLYPFTKRMIETVHNNEKAFKVQGRKFIEEHRKTLDKTSPRDLTDLFLIEMLKTDSVESDKEYRDSFFEDQLLQLIADIFAAGTESGSTILRWAILFMVRYPDIQLRVHQELDEVVGSKRMPALEDKSLLSFTIATLQEVERLSCVAPTSLPRSNAGRAQFNGYDFRPRCVFQFNIYAIHRDPKLWVNPEEFNPKRFIDNNGKVFRPPHLIPFGSGRRLCPGEGLAKVEIFLYFATLLQNFKFISEGTDSVPSLASGPGFVRAPYSYKVRAIRRHT